MTEKAPYTTAPAPTRSEAEQALRDKLDTLEFPRMLCKADGTQVRVESKAEAEAALKDGLTLLPTAPDPKDGGTPNTDARHALPSAIQQAIVSAVHESLPQPATVPAPAPVPHPPMVTHTTPKPVEDDEDDDNGKKRKR